VGDRREGRRKKKKKEKWDPTLLEKEVDGRGEGRMKKNRKEKWATLYWIKMWRVEEKWGGRIKDRKETPTTLCCFRHWSLRNQPPIGHF
jgi:hypothetical protein